MIIYEARYVTLPYFMTYFLNSLRLQFEEYVSAALSSVKYRDFIAKGENGGVMITGGSGKHSMLTFHPRV